MGPAPPIGTEPEVSYDSPLNNALRPCGDPVSPPTPCVYYNDIGGLCQEVSWVRRKTELLNALFGNIRAEAARRAAKSGLRDKVAAILAYMRPYQRVVEADPSLRVSLLSARQQGKSTFALLLVSVRCLQLAGAQWVVIGLTKGSIRRIYWDALKVLNEAYQLGLHFQEQALVATFPNGSKIHFFGADKIDEVEKLRGGRFHGAVVDECKSYPELTFKLLIEDILGPCLKGQAGQLYLIGTPGDTLRGEFYLATTSPPVLLGSGETARWSNLPATEKTRPGAAGEALGGVWSRHFWGPQTNDVVFSNPRTGATFTMWDAFLQEKRDRGWDDDHPTWRREYLGTWVPGDGRLVYRYRPHLHDYDPLRLTLWGLPKTERPWNRTLGIDFGTRDGTAMVVWAWHEHEPGLWELYSERRRSGAGLAGDMRLSVSSLAKWYRDLETEFGPFDGVVGDPSGLATMVIDTLAAEHGVHVEPAEKREKVDHIELFNNDLDRGMIHVLRGSALSEELLGNKWLEKTLGTERRKEDPSTPNDLCDAALYGFRYCRHRQAEARAPEGPRPFTPEWLEERARRERDALVARLRSSDDASRMDAEWWHN